MRFLFVGASHTTAMTAQLLLARGHEVVVIESERTAIDALAEEVDAGFLHGDGSRPHIMREAAPDQAQALFCLTDDDRVNILAALVGRSLGAPRVVPAIKDPALLPLCHELGLTDALVPDRTIGRYLADMAVGRDILEVSSLLRGEARLLSHTIEEGGPERVSQLGLPDHARAICLYRDDALHLLDDDSRLRRGDELVILTQDRHLEGLRERLLGKTGGNARD